MLFVILLQYNFSGSCKKYSKFSQVSYNCRRSFQNIFFSLTEKIKIFPKKFHGEQPSRTWRLTSSLPTDSIKCIFCKILTIFCFISRTEHKRVIRHFFMFAKAGSCKCKIKCKICGEIVFKSISVNTHSIGNFSFHTSLLSRKYFYDITKDNFLGGPTFWL